jgi:hypothetical protein
MLTYLQKNRLEWLKEVVEEMKKHVQTQEDTWDPSSFPSNLGDKTKDQEDKIKYIEFLRKTSHDPVRYGGGLSFWTTTFYKLLGKSSPLVVVAPVSWIQHYERALQIYI